MPYLSHASREPKEEARGTEVDRNTKIGRNRDRLADAVMRPKRFRNLRARLGQFRGHID